MRAPILALVAAALVGCGAAAKHTVVKLPSGKTSRVVVYVHGADETAASSFADPEKQPVFAALLNAGYAVAATDARGNNWGNPASVHDYQALVVQLRSQGLTRVYLLAQSMGGLDALELLRTVHVRAVAAIYPVCNLASIYRIGTYAAQIKAAYAGRQSFPGPIAVTNVAGMPMWFWSSPADTVVPKRLNTDPCARLASEAGARVTVTATRGNHGDPSNFHPAAIVRLFNSAR